MENQRIIGGNGVSSLGVVPTEAMLPTLNSLSVVTRAERILVDILTDEAHHAALEPSASLTGWRRYQLERRIADAKCGLVQLGHARWLYKPSPTARDYALLGRALKRLEAKKLIERYALGDSDRQTTHVRLTDAGRMLAEKRRADLETPESLSNESG